jgi:hypothetical protein
LQPVAVYTIDVRPAREARSRLRASIRQISKRVVSMPALVAGRGIRASDTERALPREFSRIYLDHESPAESGDVVRLIMRAIPHKVSGFCV